MIRESIVLSTLVLTAGASAQERFYSNDFQQCSKVAASLEATASCINVEIVVQKKRLNAAYIKLTKRLNSKDKAYFDEVQRKWVSWRDDNYNFLSEHVQGEFDTVRATSLDFMLKSIFDRASEVEMILDEIGENSL
ncbi:hypothetical protein PTKU64_73520 [Paraburkholderia terrae]|uniref:Lysozyme inhibitor LprI-like N-terminal domain-containing protein n=1 Tax=Paraburkholderia terrae TaxID=311230 RepID=A0ABM7TXT9_9BURK|nr:hypothetical protein PTKU64_73520 [Paraburkholderia terrae]